MSFFLPGQATYQAVADRLRANIMDGVYPPGSQLPAERVLGHDLGCGRDTVRAALAVLRHEQLIVTRRGFQARVALPAQRTTVTLRPGSLVTARMPLQPELSILGCEPETPLLVVADPDGVVTVHPAGQATLLVPQ